MFDFENEGILDIDDNKNQNSYDAPKQSTQKNNKLTPLDKSKDDKPKKGLATAWFEKKNGF